MYKNLNAKSLGIRGRQSELIELTLTYKFEGFDVDTEQLLKQAESRGAEHVARFVNSADVRVGSLELPLDFMEEEAEYQAQKSKLKMVIDIAKALGTHVVTAEISPFSTGRPYHEDFELHSKRIAEVAAELAEAEISLALGFLAPDHHRTDKPAQFVATPAALLTLIKDVNLPNVGLCLDLWHWTLAGGSQDDLADFPVEKILSVRVADLPESASVEDTTEEERLVPGNTNVVPVRQWLEWLEQRGYTGPVTPYCDPAVFSGETRKQSIEIVAERFSELMESSVESSESTDVEESEAAASS